MVSDSNEASSRPGSDRARPVNASARLPDIDPQRCTGCGWCVAACEPRVLSLEVVRWKKLSVLNPPQQCTGCSLCALKCPVHAITMRLMP